MTTDISPSVRVAKGASYLFIDGLVRNVVALIFLVYAARILTVADIGVVSALTIIESFLITATSLAIPSAATKFISENIGVDREDIAKEIYKKTLRFGILVSFLLVSVCAGASGLISTFILNNSAYQLLVVIVGIDAFFKLFSSFLNGTLWGLQKFREMAFSDIAAACVGYSASLLLLIMGLSLNGVVIGWVIGDSIGWALMFSFTLTSFKSVRKSGNFSFVTLVRFSIPLYVSGILSYFSGTVDKFVLLFVVGLTSLGIYNVALAATVVVGLAAGSISGSLFPQFSKLYGGHGKQALEAASRSASRYVFLIYVPMAVGLATVSLPAITLFFGSQYAPGWLPLTIVSLTMALTSASVIMNSLFMSLGVTGIFLESNVLGIVVGTVLSIILAHSLGIVGIAIARATIVVVPFVYSLFRLRRVFGLHFDLNAFRKSLIASVVMAAAVVFVESIRTSLPLLPLYVLVGASVYILMLRLTKAVNSHDITLITQLLPKSLGNALKALAKFLT